MTHPATPPRRAFVVALATALVALGCGDDGSEEASTADAPVPSDVTYVGAVQKTDAYIALVSDGERVAGYVCDGKGTSAWLEPAPLGGAVELRSRRGEALGEAAITGNGASGTVELVGETYRFEALPASGEAGLYRAEKGEPGELGYVEAGWIVLADGSVRGAKNGFIDQEGNLVVESAPKFIDSESDFVVDLGTGTGTSRVQKVDAGFIDRESDF